MRARTFRPILILITFIVTLLIWALADLWPQEIAQAVSGSISAGSASGDHGDTVSINISLSGGSSVEAFGCQVNWDSSKLSYVSTSKGSLIPGGWTFMAGNPGSSSITIGGYGVPALASSGTMAVIRFTIKETAPYGTTQISISNVTDGLSAGGSGTVTVAQSVQILSFTANPSTIGQGESSTLSWSISNGTGASIDNGVGSVNATSGSKSVSPAATTTYTLTAQGPNGPKTAKATVTVKEGNRPTIDSFTATPATIVKGQTSKLSWDVRDAKTVTIDSGVGKVNSKSGTFNVKPNVTTTYMLTASNLVGDTTATATVKVIGKPEIVWFASSNDAGDPINRTEKAWLMWSVGGADYVDIDKGIGRVNASGGSKAVSPDSNTTYTLTAVNNAGTESATATVGVTDKPRIRTFGATPAAVIAGQAVNFCWACAGATSISISPGVGPVTGMCGTCGFVPPGTETYTITASNASGSDSKSFTVRVVTEVPDLELSLSAVGSAPARVFPSDANRKIGKGDVGQAVALEVLLENIGEGLAEDIDVVLRENGTAQDRLRVSKLASGGAQKLEFSYMPLLAGDNTLEIIADPDNQVPEYNKQNNSISGRFTATAIKGVDLVISHVRVSKPQVGPSNALEVSFRITNCGNTDAAGFGYKAYICAKANKFRAKDVLVVEGQINKLDSGNYMYVTKSVILKKIKRKFYFRGFVDIPSQIAEADENNNELTKMILRSDL